MDVLRSARGRRWRLRASWPGVLLRLLSSACASSLHADAGEQVSAAGQQPDEPVA